MNITELDNYRLSDSVKFHNRLNPRLWDENEHLRSEVKSKLLEIAADFQEFLGVPDLDVKDITVSGSNAAYNYTPNSDIDLHLVVDLPKADSSEVFRELFDAKKYQYNDMHNIKIGGYDVELYVQDPNQEHHSQGIYSLSKNNWVSVPKRRKPEIDDVSVHSKVEDLAARIDDAVKSNDYQRITDLHKKIKTMRQSGLEQQGEYGSDNLAFKVLRNQGYIKKLIDARNAARDAELSLQERKKKKKKVRYGLGGYWYPGFGFGSEGDAGGGDGGGESMYEDNTGMAQGSAIGDAGAQSTWDGVSPDTQEFLSETDQDHEDIVQNFIKDTAEKLGIQRLPRVELHRDPEWSQQNKSFGMYKPESHELHVSLGNRHLLDILRTTAHELAHCAQNQRESLPDDAGDTGSDYENEAHAIAGIVMRDYADAHPELFMRQEIDEGVMSRAGAAAALAAAVAMSPAQAQDYLPQDQQPQVQQQGQLNPIQILNVARTLYRLKHNVTRAGAEEELNQEFKNYIRAQQGDPGAQNQSRVWQLQQRQQQRQQPQQQPWTGNQYQREDIAEASGYIPTDAEKNDPRFVMALSPDVRPGATGKNANKMSLKTDAQGRPALLMKTANLREGRMPQPSQGQGKYRDLNQPLGPETPPTMPAGTVRIDVSDMYDWYKLGQHISNMKGLGKHDFGAGPPSSVISFGDEETEHKFIKDLKATGLDVTDIDPKDPTQPPGMGKIKTDPTYNVSEAFDQPYPIKWEKSEYGDYDALATLDDGTHLSIMFEHTTPYEVAVSFWRNNSQEVTGEGDAQRVFATVLAAIQQFLKQEQPANISFSAVKEDDPTGSRSKLYNKLVQRYAANWGYQARSFDHDDKVEFELTKIRQNTDEDELVESLSQEFALLEDEFLGEIKMTGKNLRAEAAKTGAIAGMEFEMIVPNIEQDLEPEYEPDWDQDQRSRSFGDVRDFFYDGDYNSRRDADRLIEELDGEYQEWKQEQIAEAWERDGADYVRDYVANNDLFDRDEAMLQARDEIIDANPDLPPESEEFTELLSARLNEMETEFADTAFEDRGRIHDQAFEEFAEEQDEEYDERSFLDDKYQTMSDIQSNFDISWPHYYDINDGQDGEMDIDQVADDFSNSIGKPVNASRQYHGGRREAGHYVVEPDGSLEGDNPGDGGLEFVSPPMPIDEMISDLNKVKAWAKREGCYTNDSTGLHINISVPNYTLAKLDYVKLALLMGDEYVLELFGRSGNTYAKSAIGKIKTMLQRNPDIAPQVMDKMREHMEDIATKAIHSGTTDKYTSINTKTGYIEFRSPGGDWLDANFDKIENTLLRFTVALSAAIDPKAYRQEYLKKLYKLLEGSQTKGGPDVLQLFANYSAGELDKAALIRQVREKQLARNVEKGKVTGKMWWNVARPGYFASVEVVAASKEEAIEKGKQEYPDWRNARDMTATPLRPYQEPQTPEAAGPTLNGRPSNPDGRWIIIDRQDRETPVYRYAAADSNDAFSVLRQWIAANPGGEWMYAQDPTQRLGQPQAQQPAASTDQGNWGIWIINSNRFANQPGSYSRSETPPPRRFPSRDAAEQWIEQQRAERPNMRSDIEVREIEPAEPIPGSTLDLQRQRATSPDIDPLTPTGPGPWEVANRANNQVYYNPPSSNPIEAESQSLTWLRQNGHNEADFEVRTREGVGSTDAAQGGIIDVTGDNWSADFERRMQQPTWNIVNTTTGETIGSVTAPDQRSADSAAERFIYQWTQTTGYDEDDDYEVQLAQPATAPRTLTTPGQPQQQFTGEWKIVTPDGNEIHRFGGIGNAQADANRIAIQWLQSNPRHMQAGVEVVPVMG